MPQTSQNDASTPTGDGHHDLIVLSLAFFFIFLGPAAVQQFLIPYMSDSTGYDHKACSWILAAVYLSAVVWRLLVGYTVHWLGGRGALVFGLCTYTAFAACVYLWPVYWVVLLAAVVWGWGAAAIWVAGPTRILESQSPLKRGRASGIFYSAVFVGQAAGVLMLGQLSDRRSIFGVAMLIGLLGNGAILFLRSKQANVPKPHVWDALSIMRTLRGAVLCALLFTSSMGFGIVLSPLTSTVTATKGFGMISALSIGFYIGRLAVSWFAGWLTDRLGRVPVLSCGFFIGAAGLAIAAASTKAVPIAAAAFSLGLQAGILHIPIMAMVGDWIEPERRHIAFGALYAWGNFGRAFAIVFGQTMRTTLGGDRVAFSVFAAMMALCGVLSLAVAGTQVSSQDTASR